MLSVSSGFPPIAGPSARVLILGSLPGEVSIQRQEYYAHPQNSFWKILGDLFGISPQAAYAARAAALIANDIAVWDVCAAAHRPGSLDSKIHGKSVRLNDFPLFLAEHTKVGFIGFNGAKAAALFERRVVPLLDERLRKITRRVLPSTSPAYASLSYEAKKAAWAVVRVRTCS